MFDTTSSTSRNGGSTESPAAAMRVLAKLATEPVRGASSEHLKSRIETFTKMRAVLDAAHLHVLAELDTQKFTDTQDGLQTLSWSAKTTQTTRQHAKQNLNVARKLRDTFTEIDAALTTGEITLDQAAIYVSVASCPRVENILVAAQRTFIDLIPFCTRVEHWAAQIRNFVKLHDEDGSYNPDEDISRDRLTWTKSFNGDIDVNWRLTGIQAVTFEQHIQRETQYWYEKFSADHKECPEIQIPAHPTLAAYAMSNLFTRGITITPNGDNAPCNRSEITVLVDASRPEHAFIRNGLKPGSELTTNQTAEIKCDSIFNTLILASLGPNGEGVPLNHGMDIRLATPKQRRAIEARDGGCTWSNCDAPPSWCIIHHIKHWENFGETNLENLTMFCPHHHSVIHRNGWSMQVAPPDRDPQKPDTPPHPHDTRYEITTPQGNVLPTQRHGLLPGAPLPAP